MCISMEIRSKGQDGIRCIKNLLSLLNFCTSWGTYCLCSYLFMPANIVNIHGKQRLYSLQSTGQVVYYIV
jgi:hypothetical protein